MSETLYHKIQQFYDASSGLWEQIWGEHMHHGYYGVDGKQQKNRRQAQIDLIEEVLNWSRVQTAENILDVGCGIGGSSLYLAGKFNAQATGITLSPVQAARAKERAQDAGLSGRTQFQVADAQAMPFPDDSFDLVWSLESGEHMPDKTQFLQECYRVLKPGGKLILVTWCHRPTQNAPLTADEQKHLQDIYRVYCLPYVISLPEYEAIARQLPLNHVHTADWSTAVAPFWNMVIDSAFTPQAIFGLLTSGWTTIQGALSLGLMRDGYQRGLIRFGLLSGNK
ncbi:methyltransferase domain-containing protein [Anabaenopsis elenkinii]|uniref:Methyltransferase domain-containing protein n=1 Tax=Anabaenopsis elenkinii CCIBt3563 TaxID=2779889 RepID=A0A7U3NN75_9CYAN|nr:methyltransferase domain-containing protein [Anabaenopsis elenkinii]QOV21951.1 methyltransferase domain-containing protein [Anabaenopsis elenkinii CCIBt3563]